MANKDDSADRDPRTATEFESALPGAPAEPLTEKRRFRLKVGLAILALVIIIVVVVFVMIAKIPYGGGSR